MLVSLFLFFFIFILLLSYVIGTYNEFYWKKRGAKYIGGKNMVAMFWDFLFTSSSFYDYFINIYNENPDEPAVAVACMLQPTLFIKDPENIRYVLTENFSSFHHNGIDVVKDDKLADSVIFMNGNRWKLTRQKMTPLFTSSKLKKMHYIMDRSAKDFVKYLSDNAHDETWAYDKLALFATAALTASIFGVKTNESTFDAPFLDIAKDAIKPSLKFKMIITIRALFPGIFSMSNLKLFGTHEKRFIGAMKYVLREREKEGQDEKKHDFPEMALQLQKNGKLTDPITGYELEPTDELMAAQAFFFLVAGSEPSAMGMFAVLFELAKNSEIMKIVQDEIDKAFEDNSEINVEVIVKMKYLDKVFEEALRMHPPTATLGRRCTESTTLPVGNVKVDKGTQIVMPIYALHHDPKYYPNPEVFDPERFSAEEKRKRPNMTYVPFGKGNRLCIGQRFALLQMKTGLVHVLRNFTVKLDDVNKSMKYGKNTFFLRPDPEIDFKFIPRIRT